MTVKISGVSAEMARLRDEVERLEKEAIAETEHAASVLIDALLARTPVWSGEAAINYNASSGTPSKVVRNAPGPGEPGTNNMPLGSERNRPAAESAARATVKAVGKGDKLRNAYITNNAPDFDLVEAGVAPNRDRSRNPGGVSKIALQVARARLEHWK